MSVVLAQLLTQLHVLVVEAAVYGLGWVLWLALHETAVHRHEGTAGEELVGDLGQLTKIGPHLFQLLLDLVGPVLV